MTGDPGTAVLSPEGKLIVIIGFIPPGLIWVTHVVEKSNLMRSRYGPHLLLM